MTSINDIISSIAASNPYVGSIVAGANTQANLLAALNPADTTESSDSLMNLLAAANSEAANTPAAVFTPSAALTAAQAAANSSSTTAPQSSLPTGYSTSFEDPSSNAGLATADVQSNTVGSLLDSIG